MSDTLWELSANLSSRRPQLPSPEAGVRRGLGVSRDSDGQMECSGPRAVGLTSVCGIQETDSNVGQ